VFDQFDYCVEFAVYPVIGKNELFWGVFWGQ